MGIRSDFGDYNRLIRLDDGTIIEAKGDFSSALTDEVASSFTSLSTIESILIETCSPISSALKKMNDRGINTEQAEVELNIGFGAEGQVYLASSRDNANLNVKLTILRDKEDNF